MKSRVSGNEMTIPLAIESGAADRSFASAASLTSLFADRVFDG